MYLYATHNILNALEIPKHSVTTNEAEVKYVTVVNLVVYNNNRY